MENTLSTLKERVGFHKSKRVGAARERCCSDFEIGEALSGSARKQIKDHKHLR